MGATFSRVKTWTTGATLTAAELNAEFDNFLNNLDPTGIDDESANDGAAQATSDPYESSSLVKATSLETEIQQLRYLIKQITGETYWYVDPDIALSNLAISTIWIPASAMQPTTTNGAAAGTYEYATNDNMVTYFAFDTTTVEYVSWNMPMPENWNRSTIKAKFFWTGASGCTAADTCEWRLAGQAISNDDALDVAMGDAGEVISDAILVGTSGDLHITGATPAITVGGTPVLGDMVHFKGSRNVGGSDNMAEDGWLFGVLIQYTSSNAVTAW